MNLLTPNQRLLGFIGIGHTGSRIVRRLIDHGYDLIAYNRTPDAAEALVEHGGERGGQRRGTRTPGGCQLVLSCE